MYFGWNLGLPVGGPYGMLAATAVVTVLYTTFVLGYAELACAMPRAGGAFVYTTRAFGPHVGLLGGLAQLVEYVLAPPAVAFAIGSYVNQALPGVPVLAIAVGSYVAFTLINMWGVKLSASFELVLTVVAVVELVIFGIVVLPGFSWARFSLDPLPHGTSGVFAALPFAMWFYLAIEGIANVAEEARAPQRDLPRGFLWAMATLVVLTVITLFGAVGVDGWRSVVYTAEGTESDSPLPLAIKHVVASGSPLFLLLTSIGLVGLVASFHGILIIGGRAMLELGRVRYLPAALGTVHPRRRTPMAALATNMTVGLVALFTGRTADLIYLSVFGALTLYVLSSAAVIALRVREPALARVYRTPGYPVTPAISFVLSLVCLVAMVWSHGKLALLFAGILGTGWALFVIFVPRSERATFRS
jgi:ethanolamine permease